MYMYDGMFDGGDVMCDVCCVMFDGGDGVMHHRPNQWVNMS